MTLNKKFQGLTINIENPAGSIRKGKDRVTGKPWATEMSCDYGEILNTTGMDGQPVDVFLGKYPGAKFAFVVHQLNPNTGEFDEDKVCLGFLDSQQAKDCYFRHYDNPKKFYGDISAVPMAEFKQRLLKTPGRQIAAMSKLSSAIEMNACGCTANVGDQVVVDGLRGRGNVVSRKGKRLTVKYPDGTTLSRDDRYVHPMTENDYKSSYSSLRAGEEMVERENGPVDNARPGNMYIVKSGSLFCVRSRNQMDKDFGCYNSREEAVAAMNGRAFNGLKAGGAGSGCKGPNCGRPSSDRDNRIASLHKGVQAAIKTIDYKGSNGDPNWKAKQDYAAHYQAKRQALENFIGHAKKVILNSPLMKKAEANLEAAKANFQKTYIGMTHVKFGFAALHSALEMEAKNANPDVWSEFRKPEDTAKQGELFGAGQYGQTGWQYGRNIAKGTGYIPTRGLGGFPTAPRGIKKISLKVPKMAHPGHGAHGPQFGKRPATVHIKRTTPYPNKVPNARVTNPKPSRSANPSSSTGSGFGVKRTLESEGVTGSMGNAHIDPVVWFHPPSLTKRQPNEATRVPTDDAREDNDKFLDVTKRNSPDTKEQRMKILKRSGTGAISSVPVRTTLLQHQTGANFTSGMTGMYAGKSRRTNGKPRQFTSFARRGVI